MKLLPLTMIAALPSIVILYKPLYCIYNILYGQRKSYNYIWYIVGSIWEFVYGMYDSIQFCSVEDKSATFMGVEPSIANIFSINIFSKIFKSNFYKI